MNATGELGRVSIRDVFPESVERKKRTFVTVIIEYGYFIVSVFVNPKSQR